MKNLVYLVYIAIMMLAWLTASPTVLASTLVVVPGGKAGAPGSATQPLGSVQEALSRAQPGDTVLLRAGVYHERVNFSRSGAYANPITLEGEPGAITVRWNPRPRAEGFTGAATGARRGARRNFRAARHPAGFRFFASGAIPATAMSCS